MAPLADLTGRVCDFDWEISASNSVRDSVELSTIDSSSVLLFWAVVLHSDLIRLGFDLDCLALGLRP